MKLTNQKPTTGVPEVDRLVGGIIPGDNIVWEGDSGAPVDSFVSSFLSTCEHEKLSVVYVSFNRSPQAIAGKYVNLMSEGRFTLVDCFSSGKGNGDKMFLEYFESAPGNAVHASIHLEDPADPSKLQEALIELGSTGRETARYVFDSLTGMLDLWSNEDRVIRFFGHFCPRLYDLNTIAYWLLEKDAHSEQFLAKVRHITQVVLEVAVSRGTRTLTVKKAANRRCMEIGVSQQFNMDDGCLTITAESREGRELGLLTRMGEVLLDYPWPGNVRELENCIERAVVMSPGEALLPCLLPLEIIEHRKKGVRRLSKDSSSSDVAEIRQATERYCQTTDNLEETRNTLIQTVEETIIRTALARGISQRDLAKRLGMSRMTLRKRIREFGIK